MINLIFNNHFILKLVIQSPSSAASTCGDIPTFARSEGAAVGAAVDDAATDRVEAVLAMAH